MTYVAHDGRTFADADIARWAADVESGFANSTLTPAPPRAWELEPDPMIAKTVRVPRGLWERVERAAQEQGMNVSQFTRQALARSLSRSDSDAVA